jgi:hypothetical protein
MGLPLLQQDDNQKGDRQMTVLVQKVRLEIDRDSLLEFQAELEESMAASLRRVADRLVAKGLQGAVGQARRQQEQDQPAQDPNTPPEPGPASAPGEVPRRSYPGPDVTKPGVPPVTK